MKALENQLVIYDSNCNICSSLMQTLVRLNILNPSECRSFYDLSPASQQRINPERFKNEMAVINVENNDVMYGPEAISHIFAIKFHWLAFIFKSGFFLKIFKKIYPVLAHNRYVISLPKNWILCDCFPDNITKYRIQYIIITSILAIILTTILGLAVHPLLFESNAHSVLYSLLIAGSGWFVHLFISLFIFRKDWYDYVAHLGSIMVYGLILLIPVMIILFAGAHYYGLLLAGVALSFGFMLKMHMSRVKFLQLPRWLNFLWAFNLMICAVAVTFFLYQNDLLWNF